MKLPSGYRAAGIHCGIKSDATKLDLALFTSDSPCTAAGVFTLNRVCGAPVKVSRERLPRCGARGVVINSGNANACTGERGLDDARWMTAAVAELLGCEAEAVLVCSTGVIGHFLPRENLAAGIPRVVESLADSPGAFEAAARGMMTTDTFHKQCVREFTVAGKTYTLGGAAKGAAMIGPNMATMLAVAMTDFPLSPAQADAALRYAVDRSFNCISVEGHTSTSDSVLLLAADPAGSASDDAAGDRFQQELNAVCADLAQQIIRDAEGAGHMIVIDVRGLSKFADARSIAKTIAESALVKTAITGADPNWGRIVSAAGYSGVEISEEETTLRINGTLLYERGAPVEYDDEAVSTSIRETRDVSIELDFAQGNESVRFWTSDLTAEYVRLNSEYTT